MLIFQCKKKSRKIRIIFDIENWLWKSEIGIFSIDEVRMYIDQPKNFLWKSAIFQPIKLTFDAEAAERILKVIYYVVLAVARGDLLWKWRKTLNKAGFEKTNVHIKVNN